MLDPEVVLRADMGAAGFREVRGAENVASQALGYSRLGHVMHPAIVNGAAGMVSMRDGEPFSVGGITVSGGRIVEIDILADRERLRQLDLTILDSSSGSERDTHAGVAASCSHVSGCSR